MRSKYTDEFKDQIRSEAQGRYDNETIVKLAKNIKYLEALFETGYQGIH